MYDLVSICLHLQDRRTIIDVLLNALSRLEYRGYDSAGLSVDGDREKEALLFKQVGKVNALRKHISESSVDMDRTFVSHAGMAHTRWATHGTPSPLNCHPHKSDPRGEFTVVHNGIITNYRELRLVLEKRGYKFETDTDTEAVAVLVKYFWDSYPENRKPDFHIVVRCAVKELEGAFSFVFKSVHFPGEVVVARRGSPLLIGVKTEKKLKVDSVDVQFGNPLEGDEYSNEPNLHSPPNFDQVNAQAPMAHASIDKLIRSQSRAFLSEDGMPQPIEFFIASDASAVVEHTKRVLYLEDDDIAHIADGELHIHRLRRNDGLSSTRSIETLEMELAEIMKGQFDHFMPVSYTHLTLPTICSV